MACFLIVDDDADNAAQLASVLSLAGSGAHEFACISNLAEYRVWRRQHRADLILVELMRNQANGFSLAAALARQSAQPVVLLSDRRLASDALWAAARGIRQVLSRCAGTAALAEQLRQLINPVETPGPLWSFEQADQQQAPVPPLRGSELSNPPSERAASNSDLTAPPDAAVILRALIRDLVADTFALLHASPAVQLTSILSTTVSASRICQICNALLFLPEAKHLPGERLSAEGLGKGTVQQFIWQLEKLLATELLPTPSADALPEEKNHAERVMQVFRQLTLQPQPTEASLMLFTLGLMPADHPMLSASLAARYGADYLSTDSRLLACAKGADWLARGLAAIANDLGDLKPLHQRLSTVIVRVYKLRARLETSADYDLAENPARQAWRMIAACLYQYTCHCLLRTAVISEADISSLRNIVCALRCVAQQGVSVPDRLLIMLAAAEISAARHIQAADGHEHQMLAAGLRRLPKPDGLVSALLDDVRQSGTALSEIRHELQLLTEGAGRLGVARVESLSRLLQDCYQQLSRETELLQQKKLRLVLGRAHRVLCRLLDQAAAWRPLDEPHLESAAQKVTHELFLQFPRSRHRPPVGKAKPFSQSPGNNLADVAAGWVHCQAINIRLRQILRQGGNVNEYRSLMTALLREQHTLLAAYLPYQPVV
jgi:CheY-like chemotaxis protein